MRCAGAARRVCVRGAGEALGPRGVAKRLFHGIGRQRDLRKMYCLCICMRCMQRAMSGVSHVTSELVPEAYGYPYSQGAYHNAEAKDKVAVPYKAACLLYGYIMTETGINSAVPQVSCGETRPLLINSAVPSTMIYLAAAVQSHAAVTEQYMSDIGAPGEPPFAR